jgi:hypothetical protein
VEVIVDWGDALTSRSFTVDSMVRIETALKQDATIAGVTDTMKAYNMRLLAGSQTTELQGTDGTTFDSASRSVFTTNARLTIVKLGTAGAADTVVFDGAVYEGLGVEEAVPGARYTVELNVAGSLVYGYNFQLPSIALPVKTGQYRITFSLDPASTIGAETVPNRVKIVGKSDPSATVAEDGLSTSVDITVN